MARHTARRLTSAAFGLALVGTSGFVFIGAAHADPNPNVTICHATGNPDKFVVITIDAAAITKQGHDEHQDDRDVIPPFEYVAENSQETVTFPGQNWDDNWMTNGEGVATEEVDKSDCEAPDETSTPTPTPTPSVAPSPSVTPTTTSTPTGTSTPTPTGTSTSTPTGTSTPTPSETSTPPTPTGTSTPPVGPTPPMSTPPVPTGPVVETDIVDPSGPNPALLGGGAALLLAGAAATTAVLRRRGSHS